MLVCPAIVGLLWLASSLCNLGHESQIGLLAGETTLTLWRPRGDWNVSLTLTRGVGHHGFGSTNREGLATKSRENMLAVVFSDSSALNLLGFRQYGNHLMEVYLQPNPHGEGEIRISLLLIDTFIFSEPRTAKYLALFTHQLRDSCYSTLCGNVAGDKRALSSGKWGFVIDTKIAPPATNRYQH